ncbi:hypothetical protein ScPMuIL_003322 [Solemya velum]
MSGMKNNTSSRNVISEKSYKHYTLSPGIYPFESNYASKLCIRDFERPPESAPPQAVPGRQKLPPILRKIGVTDRKRRSYHPHIPTPHPDPISRYPLLFGEDRKNFSDSNWQSENQQRYRLIDSVKRKPEVRPQFLITSLDPRSHNPQSKCIFHIRRIHQKPVCDVTTSIKHGATHKETDKSGTEYESSFKEKTPDEPRTIVFRKEKEFKAEGIVPFNSPEGNDVRSEMLLPVCDSTGIPSAPNPHKYLVRKRKVEASHKPCGIFYPDKQKEKRKNQRPLSEKRILDKSEKISISNLLGGEFTRRKFIAPPTGSLNVEGFDGGAQVQSGIVFTQQYLPFVKVKQII